MWLIVINNGDYHYMIVLKVEQTVSHKRLIG